jgi:8-oxo-dGTP pyrophosphatase MutT (NUDIX family)
VALIRRQRAGAIVIDGDRVLVAGITDPVQGRWYAFPGGGRDEGETIEEAVVRELYEEAGLRGVCGPLFAHVWTDVYEHRYHLVECADVELGEVTGPELDEVPPEAGFAAEWLPIEHLATERVWPRVVADQVMAYASGAPIPSSVPEVEAESGWAELAEGAQPRHEALAVIVDAGRLAVVRRRDGVVLPHTDRRAGEAVGAAAVRASREQLGMEVHAAAELALCLRRPRLQSYVWCAVVGGDTAEVEWVAVGELAAAGIRPGWLPDLLPGWVADPTPSRADRFHDDG